MARRTNTGHRFITFDPKKDAYHVGIGTNPHFPGEATQRLQAWFSSLGEAMDWRDAALDGAPVPLREPRIPQPPTPVREGDYRTIVTTSAPDSEREIRNRNSGPVTKFRRDLLGDRCEARDCPRPDAPEGYAVRGYRAWTDGSHNIPLWLGPRDTGWGDITLLCASCHRAYDAQFAPLARALDRWVAA